MSIRGAAGPGSSGSSTGSLTWPIEDVSEDTAGFVAARVVGGDFAAGGPRPRARPRRRLVGALRAGGAGACRRRRRASAAPAEAPEFSNFSGCFRGVRCYFASTLRRQANIKARILIHIPTANASRWVSSIFIIITYVMGPHPRPRYT